MGLQEHHLGHSPTALLCEISESFSMKMEITPKQPNTMKFPLRNAKQVELCSYNKIHESSTVRLHPLMDIIDERSVY